MSKYWSQLKIKDIADITNGYAFKSEDFRSSGIPVIKIKSLKNNSLEIGEADYISSEFIELDRKYHVKFNDILIAMTGSHITLPSSAVGRVSKSRLENTLLLNQRVGKIKVKENVCNHDFLYYFLISDYFFQSVGLLAKGAANQANISGKDIGNIKIKLPPLPTQQKIADILSAYDDLIENNLKRIKLLEEQAQLLYKEWFVRLRFPNYKNTPIDKATGLPVGWEVTCVNNLLSKVKTTTKIKKSEIETEGNIPVIDQSKDFIAGFTNDEKARISSSKPIIIFGDHTRILKLINFDFARGADGTQVIVSNTERMPQYLFFFSLKNIDLSNYHYARHFKFLKKSEIILPNGKVVNDFNEICKIKYDLIYNLQKQNQKLKEARDILLPRLMMGIIEV